MLPLLPALLLLILNGPAGLDRMAHDGRLPEALRALSDRIRVEDSGAIAGCSKHEIALASILAAHGETDLSQVLAELILFADFETDTEPEPQVPLHGEIRRQSPSGPPAGTLREGHARSVRSRDGPAVR